MPFGNIKSVQSETKFIPLILDKELVPFEKLFILENFFNLNADINNIKNLFFIFPFNGKKYEFTYKGVCKDKFYFGEEYKGKICVIYFNGKGSITFSQNKEKNYINHIDKYFINEGYSKFHISQDLLHLRSKVKMSFGLDYYQENNEPLLVFGLYNSADLAYLKGNVGILWGGSDIMVSRKNRDSAVEIIKNNNYVNYAMSEKIYNKLIEFGINNIKKVFISFCWNDVRYKMNDFSYHVKKNIYIYDGLDKSNKKKDIYNHDLVDKFCSIIGKKFKIIRSSDGFKENIIEYYKNSFVSLRLTNHDGNANSAQECGMMDIPVISNQEMNHCITWKNIDEIVYKTIYIFDNHIKIGWLKDGVNLLFISNDMPGKGGGATFTGELKRYLDKRGFNIWEIYLIHNDKEEYSYSNKRFLLKYNQKKKWNFLGWLEKEKSTNKEFADFMKKGCKIILRSAHNEIRKLRDKFEVIFLSPGIYKNDMDGNFDLKFINHSNIRCANETICYANSMLTQQAFHKMGLNNVNLLEINFLQMRDRVIDTKRDIDFIFVVSNIDRKIKNFSLFQNLAAKKKYKFVLVSSDNVKMGRTSMEVHIDPKNINDYYQRSKCLINCSFFDSMSNVVLEAINNGCHVLVSQNNGIVDYICGELRENFVVESYNIKDWEEKLDIVMTNWDKLEKEREKLWEFLIRKSWEVEIRLLELLSRRTL